MNAAINLLETTLAQKESALKLAEQRLNLQNATLRITQRDTSVLSTEVSDLRSAVNLIKGNSVTITAEEVKALTAPVAEPEAAVAPTGAAHRRNLTQQATAAYKRYVKAYKDANLASPDPDVVKAKKDRRTAEAQNTAILIKASVEAGVTMEDLSKEFGITKQAIRYILKQYGK